MPTFKIQGQVHHLIYLSAYYPKLETMQNVYKYILCQSLIKYLNRTSMILNLKRGLIESLQTVLRENNRLIQSFRSNLESRFFDDFQNFKLIFHADRVPQGDIMHLQLIK